jgi:hypothetical protein
MSEGLSINEKVEVLALYHMMQDICVDRFRGEEALRISDALVVAIRLFGISREEMVKLNDRTQKRKEGLIRA